MEKNIPDSGYQIVSLRSQQFLMQGEALGKLPAGVHTSGADHCRIQSGSNVGQPSLNNESLSVKDRGGIHAGS
jgi:hypothetical protein